MGERLRLGLIPIGETAEASARMDAFTVALGEALREPLERYHATDYRALVSALEHGLVKLAWVPPLVAARAVRSGAVVPIALAQRSGTTVYGAALISLKKGPIRQVSDLRGLRAAWVDRESAGGYVVVRAALRAAGVSLVDAFSEETFTRSHVESARALLAGKVDVAATYVSYHPGSDQIARAGWLEADPGANDAIHIVTQAGPIPSDFFAVHQSFPTARIAAVQAALCDARPALAHRLAKEMLHTDGFVRPTREHMEMLQALAGMVEGTASGTGPASRR